MLLLKEVIEIRNKNCVAVTFYRVLLLELWHVRVPQYSKVLLIAKECILTCFLSNQYHSLLFDKKLLFLAMLNNLGKLILGTRPQHRSFQKKKYFLL